MGWLRRLCGGLVAEAMWWVRNTENKAQLRLPLAGALPELGNKAQLRLAVAGTLPELGKKQYLVLSSIYMHSETGQI